MEINPFKTAKTIANLTVEQLQKELREKLEKEFLGAAGIRFLKEAMKHDPKLAETYTLMTSSLMNIFFEEMVGTLALKVAPELKLALETIPSEVLLKTTEALRL